jgi:hypothetical protein
MAKFFLPKTPRASFDEAEPDVAEKANLFAACVFDCDPLAGLVLSVAHTSVCEYFSL